MNICILTDAWTPVWGGGQTHIWQTSQRLVSKYNISIDIIAPNLTGSTGQDFPRIEQFQNGRLRVLRLGPSFVFPSLLGRLHYCLALIWFILLHRYDLYHSHSLSTSSQLLVAKFLHSSKIFYTVHGGVRDMLGAKLLNFLSIAPLSDFLIRRLIPYDCLIGVVASDTNGYVRAKSKTLIGNGVDEIVFKNWKIKPHGKVVNILNVGRLVPIKNQSRLLLAFALLRRSHKNIHLTIIGDGPLKNQLRKIIITNHLQSQVKIVGSLPQNKVYECYENADIFILPSTFEGFPITLLETMAAGIPAIVSDAGNCAEVVSQAKSGIVLADTTTDAIETSMEKMLSLNSAKREEMGQQGRKWVLNNHTWDKVAKNLYELYTKK